MLKRTLLLFSLGTFLFAQDHSYQDVLWEKSIGGEHSEYLYHALATPDYGFLLLGSSTSDATADKQKENQGGLDYFVWKINEDGKQEWQQSFGGEGNDFLTSGALTQDGGYILGGYADSSKSGEKTEDSFGMIDFWILKLDASGAIQWQKTLGGLGYDELTSVIQTQDGGYLVGGNSDSPKSELKSEENIGSKDYWVVKLDQEGEIEWDRTLGGENTEELKSIIETNNHFIVFGQTNSVDENGQFKDFDLEIIQLDKLGEIQQTLRYGSEAEDLFSSVYFDDEKQIVHLAGLFASDDKRELKIIQLDENLNQKSESTKELNRHQIINNVMLTKNSEYLLAGSNLGYSGDAKSIQTPISSYQTMILDQNGEDKWNKEFKNDGFDYLQTALETRDGSIVLIGNSDSKTSKDKKVSSQGQQDFWIVKLGNKNQAEEQTRETVEVYPNPTRDYVNVLINQDFKEANGMVYNLAGQQLQTIDIKYRTTPINLGNYPAGVYLLKLTIDNQSQTLKIIKK